MQVTVHNRGPDEAPLHVLPTLWFRHTWSWAGGEEVPAISVEDAPEGGSLVAEHSQLGRRRFLAENPPAVLVTGNETNNQRTFGSPNEMPYLKDGIDRAVVHGDLDAVDPSGAGTKASFHYQVNVPAGGSTTLRFRLTDSDVSGGFDDFDDVMETRRREADVFWDRCSATR